MIDNDKIRYYEIKMATHVDAGFQLGVFVIKQLIGERGAIPEKAQINIIYLGRKQDSIV